MAINIFKLLIYLKCIYLMSEKIIIFVVVTERKKMLQEIRPILESKRLQLPNEYLYVNSSVWVQ